MLTAGRTAAAGSHPGGGGRLPAPASASHTSSPALCQETGPGNKPVTRADVGSASGGARQSDHREVPPGPSLNHLRLGEQQSPRMSS